MTKGGFKAAVHEKLPKVDSVPLGGAYTLGEVALRAFGALTTPTPKPFSPSFKFDTALAASISALAPS
jgi:rRNA maturation protein Nop10